MVPPLWLGSIWLDVLAMVSGQVVALAQVRGLGGKGSIKFP